jgi:hypothetical protein
MQLPAELISQDTRQPSSDEHDFVGVNTPSDFSKKFNFPLLHFNSTSNNITVPTTNLAERLYFITSQVPINHTLSAFNDETETQHSQYACDYEDPGGVPERGVNNAAAGKQPRS